jgi:hypothetical protein
MGNKMSLHILSCETLGLTAKELESMDVVFTKICKPNIPWSATKILNKNPTWSSSLKTEPILT